MYSSEEIEKAKEILAASEREKANHEREEYFKSLDDNKKNELLVRQSEELILLKHLLFQISKNKNFIIHKEDTDNKKFVLWNYDFLNKENKSNGKELSAIFPKSLLEKFEILNKKNGE